MSPAKMTNNTLGLILTVICCLICPPLGVALVAGCGTDVLVNVLLWILGGLPGVLHALYILYVGWNDGPKASKAPFVFSEKLQGGGIDLEPFRTQFRAEPQGPTQLPPPQSQTQSRPEPASQPEMTGGLRGATELQSQTPMSV